MEYQCGSCEQEFKILKDDLCPCCGSGNWVKGNIDEAINKETHVKHEQSLP